MAGELKMTVSDLEERVDAMEYLRWQVYHQRRRKAEEKALRDAERKGRRR